MAEEEDVTEAPATVRRSQRRGIFSRIWRAIFGVRNEDYEKKLQHLSKEEAAVNARMKRRALSSRRRARNLIFLSATFEQSAVSLEDNSMWRSEDMHHRNITPVDDRVASVQMEGQRLIKDPGSIFCVYHASNVVAVAIAVIALRSLDITGPMKFFRTLPAILLPGLSYIVYSALESLTRLLDRKDQKTLESLRAERKAKIDELKEMTNYYTIQQLIQRYDLDPASKVAAATALASRLGAESGLKVRIGDEPTTSVETTRSNSIEQSSVLRNKKQTPKRGGTMPQLLEASNDVGSIRQGNTAVSPGPLVVEHYRGSGPTDGGWVARIAALLIGEDPSQCYALICGNCCRHNGLARKEDFLHITYYCPHCHALNTSKQIAEQDVPYRSGTRSPSQALGGTLLARSSNNASSVTSAEAKNNVADYIQELSESAAD